MIKRDDIEKGDTVSAMLNHHLVKGRIISIVDFGEGDYDYSVQIQLDEASLAIPELAEHLPTPYIYPWGDDINPIKS